MPTIAIGLNGAALLVMGKRELKVFFKAGRTKARG
jgi:hypothetical protein